MKKLITTVYLIRKGLNRFLAGPIIIILFTGFMTVSCTMMQVNEDVNKALESTSLAGRVFLKFKGRGPIVVDAYSREQGKIKIAPHYTVLHEAGEYGIAVTKGNCLGSRIPQ